MRYATVLGAAALFLAAATVGTASAETATAEFFNSKGEAVGTATLTETPSGVLIKAELRDMPPGAHAFHIHAAGKCEPPDFKSAGGHYNPTGKKHGIMSAQGMHAGDLPNIYVGADGKAAFEALAGEVTLGPGGNTLFDEDGSALVIHEKVDDYKTDPAGNAGDRIACGVIKK